MSRNQQINRVVAIEPPSPVYGHASALGTVDRLERVQERCRYVVLLQHEKNVGVILISGKMRARGISKITGLSPRFPYLVGRRAVASAPPRLPFAPQARPSLTGEPHAGEQPPAACDSVALCDTAERQASALGFAHHSTAGQSHPATGQDDTRSAASCTNLGRIPWRLSQNQEMSLQFFHFVRTAPALSFLFLVPLVRISLGIPLALC
jgi:hypothetical protein